MNENIASWIEEKTGRAVHGEDDARNVKKTLSKIGHGRFSGRYIKDLNNPQPQAMMKIFNRRPRGASVRLLMEYIARVRDVDIEKGEPPLEMHLSDGTVIQRSEELKELFKDWEMDFEYGTLGSGEKKHRHATHIMFSADTELKNHKEVLASAKATAHLLWGRSGYEYGLSMHLDGTKPHVHTVLKDRNRITGKKSLNNNKGRLAVILEQETQEIVDKDGKKKKVKIPPADILTKVRYHGAITRFEKQVNENLNGLFSPVRKNELMKEVKALKKELRKLPRDKFEQMLSKTIENLGKSGKELQQSVEQIKAMPKNQRLIADINRWTAIESLADKQTNDIETVLREIEHIPTDVRTKKETKKAMKVLQKNIKNIKRDLSKGR